MSRTLLDFEATPANARSLGRAQTINGFKTIAVDTVEEAVDWLEQICYDVSQKPYQYVPSSSSSPALTLTPSFSRADGIR